MRQVILLVLFLITNTLSIHACSCIPGLVFGDEPESPCDCSDSSIQVRQDSSNFVGELINTYWGIKFMKHALKAERAVAQRSGVTNLTIRERCTRFLIEYEEELPKELNKYYKRYKKQFDFSNCTKPEIVEPPRAYRNSQWTDY